MANRLRPPPKNGAPGSGPYKALVALVGASAAAMAWGLQHKWEGTVYTPAPDPIGIITGCSGVVRGIDPNHHYTPEECDAKDAQALLEHARETVRCTPALKDRPYLVAAAIDFTYNFGGPTYCGSTVARRFNAGDFRGGCEFMLRYKFAGGRVLKGLERRRYDEMQNYCLKGVAS